MTMTVVDSVGPTRGRHSKYQRFYEALDTLPPGKMLRIDPCPGGHEGRVAGCAFVNGVKQEYRRRRNIGVRIWHENEVVYVILLEATP